MNPYENALKVRYDVPLGEPRVYIQDHALTRAGLSPGTHYTYTMDHARNIVEVSPDPSGPKIVSRRQEKDRLKPVLDIRNGDMARFFQGCSHINIVIATDGVRVVGERKAPEIPPEGFAMGDVHAAAPPNDTGLNAYHICAGGGVSADRSKAAGFTDAAFVEHSPGENKAQWDRYARVLEENNPEAVILNVPLQYVTGEMFPANLPVGMVSLTVPCDEDSNARRNLKDAPDDLFVRTHHLYLHAMRLLAELPRKPEIVFMENVQQFGTRVGPEFIHFLEDGGYHVTTAVLDGADYGARMHRTRWYLIASRYGPCPFPSPTGAHTTPLASEPWFRMEDVKWYNAYGNFGLPKSDGLKFVIERQKARGVKTFGIRAIDPLKDAISYTITKEYRISVPQGLLKHAGYPDTYGCFTESQLRHLFGVSEDFYAGDSQSLVREVFGQSVCGTLLLKLYSAIRDHVLEGRQAYHYGKLVEVARAAAARTSRLRRRIAADEQLALAF